MLTKVNNRVMLTSTTYDVAKKFAQVYIPAFSALYFGLANIWGLPAAEEVVGSLAVFDTFLGVCLGISARNYDDSGAAYDGKMVVIPKEDDKTMYSLELDGDIDAIKDQESIRFKVTAFDEEPKEVVAKKATRTRKSTKKA